MTHTAASLASLKLAKLKVIASELSIVPVGNKSRKQIWVDAILEHQVIVIPAVSEVPPVIVVHSTFEDEDEAQAANVPAANVHSSPAIIALVVILAVVTMVQAVVIVGVFGINLTARGADVLIGMSRRWVERLPQPEPSLIPA